MSKTSSQVTTISCNIPACDIEDVQVGAYSSRYGWKEFEFDGVEYDLCPRHAKALTQFLTAMENEGSDFINSATGVPFGES